MQEDGSDSIGRQILSAEALETIAVLRKETVMMKEHNLQLKIRNLRLNRRLESEAIARVTTTQELQKKVHQKSLQIQELLDTVAQLQKRCGIIQYSSRQ